MKVRTKAPTTGALKTHRPKAPELLSDVTDTRTKLSKGKRVLVYKVDQVSLPKKLKEINPWDYLKESRNELLDANMQAALQSVYHTASVIREQRILATKSMTLGRHIWRKILYMFKNETYSIRSIHRWYTVPFYYLKYHYLKWCISEILLVKDRIFNQFGFSYADLSKDSDLLRPKASYLRAFRTKELLFSDDSYSMSEELRLAQRAYLLEHNL
jgi:hypothetical protein